MKWVLRILGGLAGVLILGVAVLFAMSQRANAGKMRNSIELNAPAERVWAWVTEPDKLTQWVSWLVEVRGERASAPSPGGGSNGSSTERTQESSRCQRSPSGRERS